MDTNVSISHGTRPQRLSSCSRDKQQRSKGTTISQVLCQGCLPLRSGVRASDLGHALLQRNHRIGFLEALT